MPNLTAEQLVQQLSELKLIDRNDLRALVTQYDPRTLSTEELVDLLVRGELLTNYQADRLVKGERQGYFYGKYKVLYLISQGSFARVYRVSEEGTGATFAVKVLRRRFLQDKNIRERFRREGELGRTLEHPNIVAVHEVYAKGSTYYLVMDFVEGQNLREFINLRKKVAPLEATRLMKDMTAGLFYASTRGVAHRDLKLSNVLVSAQGKAKLIDFGLAGADNEAGADEVRVNAENVRTVDYAGLEKVTNVKRGDPRSDIFFAGCIYYHMLTGEAAMVESKDQMKRMVKNRFTDIRPVQQLEPELPWVVTRVVNKSLELSPSLRYQTPGEMLVDLATAIKAIESGDARPANAAGRAPVAKAAAARTTEDEAEAAAAAAIAAPTRDLPTVDTPAKAAAAKPAAAKPKPAATPKPSPVADPRSTTPREKTPAEKSSSAVRKAPTVLVIESDAGLQDKLRDKLKKYGYRVLVISDLVRGMERAGDEFSPVDAVVFNAGSLGRDAVTAFNSLDKKVTTLSIPALLLLSEKQSVWQKEVHTSPQRAVLAMPFKMKDFVEAIRTLVSPDSEGLQPGAVDASRRDGSRDGGSKDGKSKDGKSKEPAGAPSKADANRDAPSVTMATEAGDIAEAMAAQNSMAEGPSVSASLFGAHLHAMSSAPTPAPDPSRGADEPQQGALTTLHKQSNAGSKGGSKAGSKAGSKGGEPGGGRAPPPLVPTGDNMGVVDNYELLQELGQGGMGTVYRAVHQRLKREVAIKILSPDRVSSNRAVKRFVREIKLVARLDHPNIVRAHDAGGEGTGRYYLVMEYVKGIDLSDLVKKCGPLPVADACELIRQSAVGLQHAHEHHMVHRDIKPSNLVLDGKNGLVKILDLGLALLRTDVGGEELTGSGQVLGTVEYMAPEQWSDTHTVDIRADIYSLGCTMYRLLTGAPPFHGAAYANMLQKMMAHAQAAPPPLRDKRSDVSPELQKVVERMLAKNPADRFAQPSDVAAALAPFAVGANTLALIQHAASVPDTDTKEGSSSRYL